jgi:hypothetical protein
MESSSATTNLVAYLALQVFFEATFSALAITIFALVYVNVLQQGTQQLFLFPPYCLQDQVIASSLKNV